MGIFGAMTTAVGGLSAQAYALENISGNIANSQTTAFKRMETSFVDMIPDTGPRREISGSVSGYSRSTNTLQGQISASSISTHLAINGDGYFVIQAPTGSSDGQPTFSSSNIYTRRGDFAVDANGYMVNGAGHYLFGLPLDRSTGNTVGSTTVPIKITNDVIAAQTTSFIRYRASLPTKPSTTAADTTPGSELMQSSLIGQATIGSADASGFVETSIAGGSITAYDSLGNQVNVQIRAGQRQQMPLQAPPLPPMYGAHTISQTRPPGMRRGPESAATLNFPPPAR